MHTGRDVESQKSINTLNCDCDLFVLKFSTKYLLADSSTAISVDSSNPANDAAFGPILEPAFIRSYDNILQERANETVKTKVTLHYSIIFMMTDHAGDTVVNKHYDDD